MDDLAARYSWDDLRLLLVLAQHRSLRKAAIDQNISVNTMRKRIERLEQQAGVPLFSRSTFGVVPTAAGDQLIRTANHMHAAARHDELVRDVLVSPGEVRIGASEAIGSMWLAPHLLKWPVQQTALSLILDYDVLRDRTREVDISLQFTPAAGADMVCKRIATLHFMFYASKSYVEKYGVPETLDQIRHHKLVEQVSPGVRSDLLDALIGTDRPAGFVQLRTNSSTALLSAVISGMGLAGLPTYVHDVTDKLVLIDLPIVLRRELFLVYRLDARQSPAVKEALALIRRAFDLDEYPWFRDEFVHPQNVLAQGDRRLRSPLVTSAS